MDEAALSVQIPVLSIQPLVENAIKHGLAPKPGRGILSVSANVKGSEVIITVQDSGMGMHARTPPVVRGAGVGLANVKRRLQLCFGTQAGLVIDSGLVGTRVQFAIPLTPRAHLSSGEVLAQNTVGVRARSFAHRGRLWPVLVH